MPKPKTKVLGVPTKRGTIMRSGKAWRLVSPGERAFKATLAKKGATETDTGPVSME